MSLSPSNWMAAQANPGKTKFPNLARRRPDLETVTPAEIGGWACVCGEVDAQVLKELKEAGITPEGPAEFLRTMREVPAAYVGNHCRWGFRRAWYYWVAEGPGVPADKAEEFHKVWGTQVRVDGHCGCPSPLEWHHGFAVGMYHIDTPAGLAAFASLLRSIYRGD